MLVTMLIIEEEMKVTWSGAIVNDELYDVIFAADVLNKGNYVDELVSPLSVVKEQSTVYIEMRLKDKVEAVPVEIEATTIH